MTKEVLLIKLMSAEEVTENISYVEYEVAGTLLHMGYDVVVRVIDSKVPDYYRVYYYNKEVRGVLKVKKPKLLLKPSRHKEKFGVFAPKDVVERVKAGVDLSEN